MDQIERLRALSGGMRQNESKIVQAAIDAYFGEVDWDNLEMEPLKRQPTIGLKTAVRMVTPDQAEKLRELAIKSGRKVSQITREAVEEYLNRSESK